MAIKVDLKLLLAQANSAVKTYTISEAMDLLRDPGIVFIDVRDEPELSQDGKIACAVHISRGMLEFRVDPTSPYHDPIFSQSKTFVFYCASGGRSALSAQRAQEMGLQVAHVGGGLKAWKEAGGKVEQL